jgi:outer membrane biosynthesis protein TonB
MKTASGAAVITVLVMSLSGCANKAKTVLPPQAEAPILPPANMVHIPNLPALPPPPLRDVAVATDPPESPEPVHPRRTTHRKPAAPVKPAVAVDPTAQTADKGVQTQTASTAASDVSPIGQLSSGGADASSQGHQDVEHLITDTENGLNGIKRTLNSDEQMTSTQIKTFLTKARQALADNDLDGAKTLANKAKVLLEELTKK